MPLALSKTARTLNSWSPMHGDLDIADLQVGKLKDPNTLNTDIKTPYENFLPEVDITRPAFRPTSFQAKANRRRQNRQLAHSKAMFELADSNGHSHTLLMRLPSESVETSQTFAKQPRPSAINTNVLIPTSFIKEFQPIEEPIHATNNKEVRFLTKSSVARNGFNATVINTKGVFQSTWPNATVSCGSALILARSPGSVSHLRKWNSQTDLSAIQEKISLKISTTSQKCKEQDKKILSRNASLPDLRRADLLDATKFHRARPKPELNNENLLMRSPSETGRTLTFWVAAEDPSIRGEGAVKVFNETSATRRANYDQKMFCLRNHWFGSLRNDGGLKQNGIKNNSGDRVKEDNSSQIHEFTPKLLAEELTLLGREVLLAVEPVELITFVMKPAFANEENCPNLHRILCFYQRITGLVTSEILRSDNQTKRSQILAMFIEIADICRSIQNWQSSKAIVSAILSPPVARLSHTWTQLQKEHPYHYSLFESLINEEVADNNENGEEKKPKPLAALSYFGDVVSRIRGRPTIESLRPSRPLWKEPPSMAKWVEEQIAISTACDSCNSTTHKNRACCYLMAFVLGKNLFCPVRRMPDAFVQTTINSTVEFCHGDMYSSRLDLAKVFDDPESLPFTSKHIECCALQPQRVLEIRQRAEIFLRSAQATARAYDLQSNQRARNFLLKQNYSSSLENIKRSWLLERKTCR